VCDRTGYIHQQVRNVGGGRLHDAAERQGRANLQVIGPTPAAAEQPFERAFEAQVLGPASVVVVQIELVRMRPEADRIELLLTLVIDPRSDQVLSEHVSTRQERMILIERMDGLLE